MMLMCLYDDHRLRCRLLHHHRCCCLHRHRPLCPRKDCPEVVFVEEVAAAVAAAAAVVVEAMSVIRKDN